MSPIDSRVYLWSELFAWLSTDWPLITGIRHLIEVIQLPTFMGYVNPARSSTAGIELATIGSGFGGFKGLVKTKSPLKMISYGVTDRSNIAEAKGVHINGTAPLFVKSIDIFPLPGEWERTVGFYGTCAKATQLLFSPFQGALPYCTRMVPDHSTGMSCMIHPAFDSQSNVFCSWRTVGTRAVVAPRYSTRTETHRTTTGSDPAGLPLPWDESTFAMTSPGYHSSLMRQTLVPVYDARALCTNEVDIGALQSYGMDRKDKLERFTKADVQTGSFVGVVHCAKWIPSAKHPGKERVHLAIVEVYLLADVPEADE
jgi:hypothetical protein